MPAYFLHLSGSKSLIAHMNHSRSFLTGWTLPRIAHLPDGFLYFSQNELSKSKLDNVSALFKTLKWFPNASDKA